MPTKEKAPLSKKSCSSKIILIFSSSSVGNLSRGVNSLMKIISVFVMIVYQMQWLRCGWIGNIRSSGEIANDFYATLVQCFELQANL